MAQGFLTAAKWLDRLARGLCMLAALVLTLSMLVVVVGRYGFGTGSIKIQDAANYAFAAFVIFALPVCMAQGGHVRVEVLSERLSPRYRIWADRVALVLFLIPVFWLIIWAYWPSLMYSWAIREAAIETGGLPGLYLVKTTLPLAAGFMIVQGIAAVLRRDVIAGAQTPEHTPRPAAGDDA